MLNLKTHGARIAIFTVVMAAVIFDYALLARVAHQVADYPVRSVSRGENMNRARSFRNIPPDLKVRLRIVPERQQRYDTAGDWMWTDDTLEVRLSREVADKDPRYATLLFVHEVIEALLCRSTGVTAAQVDSFDMAHPQDEEPGANPEAPYHSQHDAAQAAERALARRLGVDWKDYLAGLQR